MTLPLREIACVFGSGGPRIIADIGAADGLDSLAYAKHFPHAVVFAFEPRSSNLLSLRQVERQAVNLTAYQMALGDQPGFHALYLSGGSPPGQPERPWPYSSSLLPPKEHLRIHPWCTFKDSEIVSVARYDMLDLPPPEYVHIDVQGAELSVLRGFGEKLASVRAIWMEVSNVEMYEGQPLRIDVKKFMEESGFALLVDRVGERVPQGDQFWVRV